MNLILATQLSACSVDGAMVPGMASGRGLISLRHRTKPAPGHVAGKGDNQETTKRTWPALMSLTLSSTREQCKQVQQRNSLL
jgi:hypothetical protein